MSDRPGPERVPRGVRRVLIVAERLRRQARRSAFVARVRAEAVRVDSGLALDVHPSVRIGRGVTVEVWPGTSNRLVLAPDVRVGDGTWISLRGGELIVGAGTELRRQVTVTCGGRLRVGDGVVLCTGVHLHCHESLEIGPWTLVAEYATVADSDHVRTPGDEPVHHAVDASPVVVGRNAWIGAKATVTKGVTVGDRAFVGAGSVVTDDVAAGWLVAGVPARPVRELASSSDQSGL